MPLTAIEGYPDLVNRSLLLKAFDSAPALILDCGNSANVHALFPHIREEQLHDVYVVNAEAIYRFRDVLRQVQSWKKEFKLKCLVITTIHILYSYDNQEENYNVLEHCWELMKEISSNMDVFVGIAKDQMHNEFAVKFSANIIHA